MKKMGFITKEMLPFMHEYKYYSLLKLKMEKRLDIKYFMYYLKSKKF